MCAITVYTIYDITATPCYIDTDDNYYHMAMSRQIHVAFQTYGAFCLGECSVPVV